MRDGRHEREAPFGALTMMVCAVASRWSDDVRVLPKEEVGVGQGDKPEAHQYKDPNTGELKWTSAGWDFYTQVHQRYRRNLIEPTTVYDLQMMAVSSVFLSFLYGLDADECRVCSFGAAGVYLSTRHVELVGSMANGRPGTATGARSGRASA